MEPLAHRTDPNRNTATTEKLQQGMCNRKVMRERDRQEINCFYIR